MIIHGIELTSDSTIILLLKKLNELLTRQLISLQQHDSKQVNEALEPISSKMNKNLESIRILFMFKFYKNP